MGKRVSIMFHSVGLDRFRWSYPQITEPVDFFERRMAALRAAGYSTVFFASEDDGRVSRPKQLALTFDDGYLDNWVHVLPILRKYDLKATVFVTPEFVDPRSVVRSQVEPGAFSDSAHEPARCCAGFLSWPELREMERSGLVDIQCHGLTHGWNFTGPQVVDFWRPGAATEEMGPVWMVWNSFPDLKPHYLTRAVALESRIAFGTPIYEHGKALSTRRFFPGPELREELTRYVRDHGNEALFGESDWQDQLASIVQRHGSRSRDGGRFETDTEYRQRVERELVESKERLEEHLGKKITAICWPGGGVNDAALKMAREAGYKYFTLPSVWRNSRTKREYRDLTPRIGNLRRVVWRGRDLGDPTPREFIWRIEAARGSRWYRFLNRSATAVRYGWSHLKHGWG